MLMFRTRRVAAESRPVGRGDARTRRHSYSPPVVSRLVAGVAGVVLVAGLTLATGSAAGAAQTVTAPSSGAAGTNILITGAGWPGFDSVSAFLKQGSVNTFFCSLSADASGNLGPAVCTLPTTLPQGAYTLVAKDNTISASMPFTLNPGATVAATSSGSAITSVAAGQTLFLSGFGFKASSTITSVKFGTTSVTTTPATPATSTTGAFSGASFVVPPTLAGGISTVTVTDALSHSASLHLTVFKATDTSASSGLAGKNFVVTGSGWPSNDSVFASLVPASGSSTFVCTTGTDANGTLGPNNCGLPTALTQGSYTLLLSDNSGLMVTKGFTLNPGAQVAGTSAGSPITSVAAGQTLFLSGQGFAGSSTIASVKVGTTAVILTPTTPPTSATGQFSGVTFTVPAATAAGAKTVTVTDALSHSATLHLTVFKATDTSASSGLAGKNFVVTGSGWPLTHSVFVSLVQGSSKTFVCTVSTDGAGNLGPAVCTLPQGLPQGSYTLMLTDNSIVVNTPFTLNPSVTLTNTSSQPINSAARGSTVDFSGLGFTASGKIKTVKIGTTTVTTSPAAPALSAQGSFSGASFVVPTTLAKGSYTVTFTDSSGKKATAPLAVT